jgi:hypothetical protein
VARGSDFEIVRALRRAGAIGSLVTPFGNRVPRLLLLQSGGHGGETPQF